MDIHWETIAPELVFRPETAEDVLRESLSGSQALRHLLDSGVAADEPILLLVNDPHRSTQTRPVLSALAKSVGAGGAATRASRGKRALPVGRAPHFRAIVATGTHRFTATERGEFEGATFAESGLDIVQVAWHDASDGRLLAETAGVQMHRWLCESRFLVPIGSVEPHYFAGVTGPHKTVTIGCMSAGDIERNHAGALSPASDVLRLGGNPVFDGIVEILRRLESSGKVVCAIGEVVCGEMLIAAAVGDAIATVDELLPTVRRIFVRDIACPADVLRLRVPLPLGRNLYQADKAIKNNHLAVRDGGGIVLEADCPEGVGADAFLSLLRRCDGYATARRILGDEGYRLGDHKAVKLLHLMDPACRNVRVVVVSPNLSADDLRGTGIEVFPSMEPALDRLAATVAGPINRGLVVEDAGMVCVGRTELGGRMKEEEG